MLRVFLAALADDVGILANTLEVTAIYLYARLVGEHLQEDARLGRVQRGADSLVVTFAVLVGVQAPVVVETCGVLDLVKLLVVDVQAQRSSYTEVHRRTFYGLYLARCHV